MTTRRATIALYYSLQQASDKRGKAAVSERSKTKAIKAKTLIEDVFQTMPIYRVPIFENDTISEQGDPEIAQTPTDKDIHRVISKKADIPSISHVQANPSRQAGRHVPPGGSEPLLSTNLAQRQVKKAQRALNAHLHAFTVELSTGTVFTIGFAVGAMSGVVSAWTLLAFGEFLSAPVITIPG
ncbi:hypothetical protein DFP72DRAFT_843026 [Ephemerocybe angulata]|uniref:Uncharacterized protein n=1 Tax=Ephemerocybe angulata TaxID=980116 RepID=A0A8H6IAG0_9AGAR|nr:hypothetical protein DFP72DRAFT_843026 [Tulosesus angulatus]